MNAEEGSENLTVKSETLTSLKILVESKAKASTVSTFDSDWLLNQLSQIELELQQAQKPKEIDIDLEADGGHF